MCSMLTKVYGKEENRGLSLQTSATTLLCVLKKEKSKTNPNSDYQFKLCTLESLCKV